MQAIKHRYGCVYVCLTSSTKSPVDSYLSVYVIVALLHILKRSVPRDVCVFIQPTLRVGMGMCMHVCLAFPFSSKQILVCICMFTPLNDCDYIMQLVYC